MSTKQLVLTTVPLHPSVPASMAQFNAITTSCFTSPMSAMSPQVITPKTAKRAAPNWRKTKDSCGKELKNRGELLKNKGLKKIKTSKAVSVLHLSQNLVESVFFSLYDQFLRMLPSYFFEKKKATDHYGQSSKGTPHRISWC